MLSMLLSWFDQNVIQIHQHKWQVSKHLIHVALKHCRCISQAKSQDSDLKQALVRPKCCVRHILISYAHLMIARLQIQGAKNTSPLQPIKQVITRGKGYLSCTMTWLRGQ